MKLSINIVLVPVAIALGILSLLFIISSVIVVYKARGEPIDFKPKKTST